MFFSLTNQWKLNDLTVKYIVYTGESVKKQITDSINEKLTDSDLESMNLFYITLYRPYQIYVKILFFNIYKKFKTL